MQDTSVIEISASALENNIRFLREHIGPNTRFASVVKGNAYGHGIEHFVPLAECQGIDLFAVFSATEAAKVMRVRRRKKTDVMVMGFIADEEIEWAIENGIAFWVFERGRLNAALEAAQRVGQAARIHLELETGLQRTGFTPSELASACRLLKKHRSHFQVEGVCTHLAGAESVRNHVRIQKQMQLFDSTCSDLARQKIAYGLRHSASSAAAFSYPRAIYDLVRFGIAQYGFWPSRETYMYYFAKNEERGNDPLRRLISWKTRVMSVKRVKAGKFIGYGTSFLPEKDTRIAVVPIGYAYGFARSLSNQGRVLIRGKRASVVSLVNMNHILVDVTNIPGVRRGDEVVLIGRQGGQEITVASFSELTRMLDYELLTRLPQDIPRIVVS